MHEVCSKGSDQKISKKPKATIQEVMARIDDYQQALSFLRIEMKRIAEFFEEVKPLLLYIINEYSEGSAYYRIFSKDVIVYWNDGIQDSYTAGSRSYIGISIMRAERKTRVFWEGDNVSCLAGDIEKFIKNKLAGNLSTEEQAALPIRVGVSKIIPKNQQV